MRTHNIPPCYGKIKKILIMPPELALLSTLIGSNYPCLELIFMVPKVFEPLKFDCIYAIWKKLYLKVHQNMTIKYPDIASYVMSLSQSRCWAHVFCFINAYSLSVDFIKEG